MKPMVASFPPPRAGLWPATPRGLAPVAGAAPRPRAQRTAAPRLQGVSHRPARAFRPGGAWPPRRAWVALRRACLLTWAGLALLACGRGGAGGELIVQVVDASSGRAIPWAVVQCAGRVQRVSPAGLVRFAPNPGSHALSVGAQGYQARFDGHQLHPGQVAFRLVALDPVATTAPEPGLALQRRP